ncbi:MAG TPA: laccase domain-containing protein [Casimicrobiaceae bacterium]|nr:laccase domain-containing protein [Casimicrobiaceae bacterium]
MEPGQARMDFEFESMRQEFVREIEAKVNAEVAQARAVSSRSLPREEAFAIPDLIRTKINLLPAGISEVRVVEIDGRNRATALDEPPDADAAVVRGTGAALAVRAADCLPVLFADRGGTVAAAAHAGWRGLAEGVLDATVAAMGAAPGELVAWIGPAIGPRAFEVGRDVFDAFVGQERSDAACFVPQREDKWFADLPALARARLARLGVRRVAGGCWCTVHDPARFHSWRRDRSAGRMATAIALLPRDACASGPR